MYLMYQKLKNLLKKTTNFWTMIPVTDILSYIIEYYYWCINTHRTRGGATLNTIYILLHKCLFWFFCVKYCRISDVSASNNYLIETMQEIWRGNVFLLELLTSQSSWETLISLVLTTHSMIFSFFFYVKCFFSQKQLVTTHVWSSGVKSMLPSELLWSRSK